MARTFVLSLLLTISAQATALTTVWDEAKADAYKVVGKIVSIAVRDTEILVRIKSDNVVETYSVCSSFPGGDSLNLIESERLKSLREAFNHGDTVNAAYNSPFDRCIYAVEVSKDENGNDKVADKTMNKSAAITSASQKQSHL